MITDEQIRNWFTSTMPADDDTVEARLQIRASAMELATKIRNWTPPSADQRLAIQSVREAVLWAEASLKCGGA